MHSFYAIMHTLNAFYALKKPFYACDELKLFKEISLTMILMDEESFEDNVKTSFRRAKEHNQFLESEVNALKELVYKQNSQIEFLLNALKDVLGELRAQTDKKGVSSGNEGVYSFIHSFDRHSFNKQTDGYALAPEVSAASSALSLRRDLLDSFKGIPRQELLAFLTIYQLEEDSKRPIGYAELAMKMGLSEGCIRTYISSLLRRGLPLVKVKQNNKVAYLSISKDFRDLKLKNELVSLFYHADPEQTKLG